MSKRPRDISDDDKTNPSSKRFCEEGIEKAFEWRTIVNDLKSLVPLIKAAEFDQPETARLLELQIVNQMSSLTPANQQRMKDLSFAFAHIQPEYMTNNVYAQLQQDIRLQPKSAAQLYDTICREIHDPSQKFKWMTVAAEKGHVDAQIFLGWCYSQAKYGCVENNIKAAHWYLRAVKQDNNVEAQHHLDHLVNQYDCPKTQEEADERFCKANTDLLTFDDALKDGAKSADPLKEGAKSTDPLKEGAKSTDPLKDGAKSADPLKEGAKSADPLKEGAKSTDTKKSEIQLVLAHCYKYGYGTQVNFEKAFDLYTKSAENGNVEARQNIVFFYAEAQNQDEKFISLKDYLEKLYKLANEGEHVAQEWLATILLVKKYGPTNLEESTKWRTLAAENGNSDAMYELGCLYMVGKTDGKFTIEKDTKKAFDLFLKSAKKDDIYSAEYLGKFVNEKQENIWDNMCTRQEQLVWLKWAALRGNTNSQIRYAIYCYYSHEVAADVQEDAFPWLFKASNRINVWAWHVIGNNYLRGRFVDTDITEAVKWFNMAANKGYRESQYSLGHLYYYGSKKYEYNSDDDVDDEDKDEFTPTIFPNKVVGLSWMQKAADANLLSAKQWLAKRIQH